MTTSRPSTGRLVCTAFLTTVLGTYAVTQAQAADVAVYQKSRVAAVAPYDWSGVYVGGQAGGVYTRETLSTPGGELLSPISSHGGSFFAGGYLGYNHQMSRFVIGVEGDFSAVLGARELSGRQQTIVPGIFASQSTDPTWLASAAVRLGLALDNWLLYAKAGGAWMNAKYKVNVENAAGAVLDTQTVSKTRNGWLVGAGVEYGWSRNWISRLEYNYVDFGTSQVTYTFAGLNAGDFQTKAHIVKAGLAYKF